MNAETLRCRCGIEVRIVRLNPETLTFGHVRNPGLASHPVRLARSSSDPHPGAVQATSEGPATRREDVAPAGPSNSLTTDGKRAASKGSTRSRITPSGISSPAGRASQSGVAPRPRLRPARSAGSVTAGEGV